ncbi:MAG: SIMPL domain-containing protein [bacterium]|nr:MAG: SIMPL domain-containing protein [bacterium]
MESAFFPWKKYLGYTLAVLLLIFVYSWITSPMIVSVTGSGEVTAVAETATMTFTLSVNSDSPQNALALVKNLATSIKQNLATSGIPESSLYESQATVVPASAVTVGATGFQAVISMGLKTNQINNLDAITNSLYSQGASIVSQPILTVGNIEELEKDAYNLAIKNAKKKAGSIALSNLKPIRKIVLIEQSQTQPSSTVTTKADIASQVEMNISPDDGLIKISKVVSVSYKMW